MMPATAWAAGFSPASEVDALDVTLRALRGMAAAHRPLEAIAISRELALEFVAHVHRHAPPPAGWKYGAAIRDAVSLVGVVIVGRPVARRLDDGATLEVIRLAVLDNAPPNSCSQLLGRAARVARELGYRRLVSYTLEAESGASLRAAGFRRDAATRGGSWDRRARRRQDADRELGPKTRWIREL